MAGGDHARRRLLPFHRPVCEAGGVGLPCHGSLRHDEICEKRSPGDAARSHGREENESW